jgi:hypothetical protein
MARPIGSEAVLNGKRVRWSGDQYQWQSPGSYEKLKQSGHFRIGRKELDALTRYLGPLTQHVTAFQQQVRKATPWLDPVEKVVNKAVSADDRLPSSRVAQGGAVAAQRAGQAANLDPRLTIGIPMLLGAVHTSGPRAGTTKLKPRRDLQIGHDQLEDLVEGGYQHVKQTGGLKGYKTTLPLPDGQEAVVFNRGNVDFDSRNGLTIKTRPAAQTTKAVAEVKPAPKPIVAPKAVSKPAVPALAPTDLSVPSSIVDPRYMGTVEPFTLALEKHAEQIKALREGGNKSIPRTSRLLNQIYGEPNPQYMWDVLKDVDPADFDNLETLLPVFRKADAKMSALASKYGYAPKFTEGHHPIQVESVAKASTHLPFEDRMRFVDNLYNDYTYSGNAPEDMFQLSPIGHQGNYIPKGIPAPVTAHNSILNEDLANPNHIARTGDNWSTIDFSQYTDPKQLSDEFWRQSGEPQMRMAEIAYDQPSEVSFRTQLSRALGIRERELYAIIKDNKPNKYKSMLKEMGINADIVKDIMQRSYQLP